MSDATTGTAPGSAHPLDRVVWNALTGRQRRLALGHDRAWRFPAAVAPFAAIEDTSAASFDALRTLIAAHGPAALVTPDAIEPPAGLSVIRRANLLQMIWQRTLDPAPESGYVTLGEADVPDMLALTTAAQPGPFGPRTFELGHYIGIRSDGRLAAMAGERMQVDGYTEISAVCVDAAFRRQGLAARLMRALIAEIDARADTPFLHVLTSNQVAIERYLALGFVVRREMSLLVLGGEHA
ncbi:acetyltransferase (GNAT) family protein [Burkholderia cenocepacia]|uniref:Acetyltransferase (GNAT) family protein n=1 Tax=Burkholderia cenocepacia TaxID=95486 RepID=A0A6J5JV92_9BURK|nr:MULTISPECIES: GNAT family N-acetyltransferase [Burkholderia cepacia complex]CAB3975499.1 acetyltransferase (GNAT) family protein [Burkholderia cenocepacia]